MLKPVLSLFIGLFCCSVLFGQSIDYDKIGPNLWDSYTENPDQVFSFYAIMEDQYDIHRLHEEIRTSDWSLDDRAKKVNTALRTFAANDQYAIIESLERGEIKGLNYFKPHWLINVIYLEGSWTLVESIATRDDVSLIQQSGTLVADETETLGSAPVEVMNTESTLFKINAHKMWELGYTGYGVTCLTADTGVDPYHQSIIGQQRANLPDQFGHAFYHDQDGEYSFDCGTHGTHVTGTILGLDRLEDDTIGVAFNGQWMGAAVLCGIGTADNVDAFEWAMDPDGNPNTTEDMPAFINNSWYDPSVDDACENIYVNMLTAVEAAGIGIVFSAGNEGSGSSTITNPKNLNMGLVNTFAVGALNNSGSDITNFSSRGPSQCFSNDSSLLIKPEVSAPGQSVRSCVPGGVYDFKSGTSMAAPHVAGALMLLKEAFPALSGEDLKLALYYTAVDMGAAGEDNVFGMGIIDVFAAYEYLLDQGNVPADPSVQTDLFVFGLKSEQELCQSNIPCSFGVENGGSQAVTGMQFTVTIGEDQFTIILDTLTLEPGERHFIDLDSVSNKLGEQYLSVEVKQLDASVDGRPLNDRIITKVNNKPLFPSEFTVQNEELCVGGMASISGTLGNDWDGYFEWYSDANLINQIGEGTTLNLLIEEEETQLFAKSVVKETVGPKAQQAYINYPDQAGKGIMIKVNEDVFFKSFLVNVETPGSVFFRIYEGNDIEKTIVNTLSTGVQEIFVGLDLRGGREYEIQLFNGLAKLLSHDYDMPYSEEGNIVDILYSIDAGGFELEKYFFVYDMEFEFDVDCSVKEINLSANGSSSIADLSFELEQDQFNTIVELATINPVLNITGSYSELLWDFGDGTTSAEQAPSHTYSSAGVYVVSLHVWDENGCESVFSKSVQVESYLTDVKDVSDASLIIYPNPFNQEVYISKGDTNIKLMNVFDASGKLVVSEKDIQENIYRLKLDSEPAGLFFIQIWNGESWISKKLIKQ